MLEKHEVACGMMHGLDWSKWDDGTPAQKMELLPPAQEHILQHENGKDRFLQIGTELSQAFALCTGGEDALEIRDDISSKPLKPAWPNRAANESLRKFSTTLPAATDVYLLRDVLHAAFDRRSSNSLTTGTCRA
jgi:hypothetical protein